MTSVDKFKINFYFREGRKMFEESKTKMANKRKRKNKGGKKPSGKKLSKTKNLRKKGKKGSAQKKTGNAGKKEIKKALKQIGLTKEPTEEALLKEPLHYSK